MKWIEVKPGCEMPNDGEHVVGAYIDWEGKGDFIGAYHNGRCEGWMDEDGLSFTNITHWARVELPA